MQQTNFNRSGLVHVLAGLGGVEVPESKQAFAERLGLWLDFRDAIPLFSVLNQPAGQVATPAAVSVSPALAAFRDDYERVQGVLLAATGSDAVLRLAQAQVELATPDSTVSGDSGVDFSPFHRYYLARQRDMAAGISPLRAKVRASLAGRSAPLKRLAELDAVLEQAMLARERQLLATVPLFLASRFETLYKAHRAEQGEASASDDPLRWLEPGGWLTQFCQDMQTLLRAELDLRWQPVLGLMAALGDVV